MRRDGRVFLRVPVWLGVADSLWEFEITAEQVATLADRARYDLLRGRLDGVTDKATTRRLIEETCSG